MAFPKFLPKQNLTRFLATKCPPEQPVVSTVNVCVLGAHTPLGKFLSFLLKQNPLTSLINLQGICDIQNMALDLNTFDTRSRVNSYDDNHCDTPKALRAADIVVMLPKEFLPENTCIGDRIMKEGKHVYDLARMCIQYSPKAVIVVGVPPISVMTCIVENVFKDTHFYHPGRILGSAALAQMTANVIISRYQDLDPARSHTPLVGGPDIDLAVPLFSKSTPVEVGYYESKSLLSKFRQVPIETFPKICCRKNHIQNLPMAEAYGLNQLITMIGLGLCGCEDSCACAYIRSNVIDTCKHMVSTLHFGCGGVYHNYGLPRLNKIELNLLERAALEIYEREQMACDLVSYLDEECATKQPPFKEKENEEDRLLRSKIYM